MQEIHGKYADVNGARLYYELRGTGEHVVVLLHAGICDRRMWDDQIPALSERYRVLRFDQRGFGSSERPYAAYSAGDDTARLLVQLGIARAALVGCSLGGSLSLDLALTHPEMVDALVMVCCEPQGFASSFRQDIDFAPLIEAASSGNLGLANELELRVWVDGPHRTPEQVNPQVRERVREMNALAYARQSGPEPPRIAVEPPAAERLGEIHVPTLVIGGALDQPAILGGLDAIATGIPGARKVLIDNAAHLPNMERPEEFNGLVLNFLASVWP